MSVFTDFIQYIRNIFENCCNSNHVESQIGNLDVVQSDHQLKNQIPKLQLKSENTNIQTQPNSKTYFQYQKTLSKHVSPSETYSSQPHLKANKKNSFSPNPKTQTISQKISLIQMEEDSQDQKIRDTVKFHEPLPKRYLWIDPNIQDQQNKSYFDILKGECKLNIRKMFTLQRAQTEIIEEQQILRENNTGQTVPQLKYQVICAASLSDNDFKKLQNNPKIVRIILFCQNKQRAELLKSNFKKIKQNSIFYKIDSLKQQLLRIQQDIQN